MGPKHSGKTSTGRALAAELNEKFSDLDELVEMETGKTPRTLYKEGSGIFQKAEAIALHNIFLKNENCVIAAGGGLIDNVQAMEILQDHPEAVLVYLEVSAETAWKRIIDNSADGELPAFLDRANPQESHYRIHTARAEKYRAAAGLIIPAENKTPQTLAKEIAGKLNKMQTAMR
ncbi:MAG: shikimate kinase [Treponema sp.]|nr:shikimate kinase [Treponema sp.]